MSIRTILLLALMIGSLVFTTSSAFALPDGGMEKEILELVNNYRKKKNLPPLEMNSMITDAAEKHSSNMARKKVAFGHGGFDERTDALLQNIKGSNAAAENVAYGSRTAEDVVEMWLNSKGHRKNIEGNFNLTGIGTAKDKSGVIYYTQIFINRK